MKLKKLTTVLAFAGLMTAAATPAHAYIAVNGWKVDLGAIGVVGSETFTGFGVLGDGFGFTGINAMTFNALYHANGVFTGPANSNGPTAAPGDIQTTNLAGIATDFIGSSGSIPLTSASKVKGIDFELTFVASTTQMITTAAPVTFITTTTHLPATFAAGGFALNGILEVYADSLTGPADPLKGNTSTGASGGTGLNNGVLIATFQIIPSGPATGSFNPSALDGQDDSLWMMLTNPYNAILDSSNNPLLPGVTLAFTNSNTDGDDDNDGILNTNPTSGLFAGGQCALPQTNAVTCGIEDGSFNLEKLPEPGSLGLLGLGLAGLFGARRRRTS